MRGRTRLSKRGSARLRTALYMPAISAKQHNPVLKAFAQRLLEAGIGKTAFVSQIVRQGIEAGRITELIWLDCPSSCASVWEAVKRKLPPDVLTTANVFTNRRTLLLVLDDLSLLMNDLPTLNRLLSALAPITICLIHPTPLSNIPFSVQVRLDGLSLIETHTLIRSLEGRSMRLFDGVALSNAEIMGLWESSHGNPAAVLRDFYGLIKNE